jgi:hypothetical protein
MSENDTAEDSRNEPFAAFFGSFHPVHNMRARALVAGHEAATVYAMALQTALLLSPGTVHACLSLSGEQASHIGTPEAWEALHVSGCVWDLDDSRIMLRVSYLEVVEVLRHLAETTQPMRWRSVLVGESSARPDRVVCE